MKSEKRILTAFVLNLMFSIFEIVGGVVCGSVAITSDAVHDMGDAVSIGIAYFLERKSNRPRDEKYTYGYRKYSLLGSLITSMILIIGSVGVTVDAVRRLMTPVEINYNGMTVFAIVGLLVNLLAVLCTRGGDSMNRRMVSLHMLEDVLGWAVVLVGSVVMRFTDLTIIDPLMSIGVSVFILVHAVRNAKEIGDVFLEKIPRGFDVTELIGHISSLDGVRDVHHVHVRSIDGVHISITMHVVTSEDAKRVKDAVRAELREQGVSFATIETELPGEACGEENSDPVNEPISHHHHHHHH